MRLVHIVLCTLFLSFSVFSQKESRFINIKSEESTLSDIIDIIEIETDYFFTYNSKLIPAKEFVFNSNSTLKYTLKELLFEIENQFLLDIEIEDQPTSKIYLSPSTKKIITGYIVDNLSKETIIGATVFSNSNVSTISNVNGYFRIVIPSTDSVLYFQNMGYLQKNFKPETKYSSIEIPLVSNLDFDIIITPDPQIKIKQNNKLGVDELNINKGIGGTPDLFGYLRTQPFVSSGSEGQNGLIIRGGGPDQNMILLDGMPIYEGSHLGGLSSIFLPNAIKNISIYKSAFPAKFGGRLSGVLDVDLKEGDAHQFNRSLSIGLEGLTAHIDGPLGEKTTINLNGKFSWFSNIIEPIVKASSNIENLDLKYNDTYVKVSHKFSKDHRLSITGYLGEDLVKIERSGSIPNNFKDFNRISWGNKILGLNYKAILQSNLSFTTNIGVSNYNYRSRGTYQIRSNENGLPIQKSYDILSISNLTDLIITPQLEYYSNNLGKFTFGLNYIKHKNEPTIIESEIFTPSDDNVKVDTTYRTDELAFYLENRKWLNPTVYLNSGVRLNSYFNNDIEYLFLQPRISFNYKKNKDHIQLSYARMSQFTHLLSNPGLGIPSDLWVPSTSSVPPELSHNFSLDYKYYDTKLNWGVALFYKTFSNVIEYSNPADILYSFILDDELFQIKIDNNSWEERVSLGSGRAYGLETFINYKVGNYSFDLAYTISKSQLSFSNIDDGEYYPYRFDRPHDINANIAYQLTSKSSFSIHWTFGNGNAYTFADRLQPGPSGNPIAVATSRNNRRLQNYHHLDINYEVVKKLKNKTTLKLNLGIYNIYNRQNPFYEYLSENTNGEPPELVKISLFPILPQVNLNWNW